MRMRAGQKNRLSRQVPQHGQLVPSAMTSGEREDLSALKMRRNKKNVTAAQAQGKVTGRWTEEEHQRFQEGKFRIQIFFLPLAANVKWWARPSDILKRGHYRVRTLVKPDSGDVIVKIRPD